MNGVAEAKDNGSTIALHPAMNIRKIYVQRDYSKGTVVQFQTTFPAELEGRVHHSHYTDTLTRINDIFLEAERLDMSTYLSGCLACLTAYLVYVCIDSRYEKVAGEGGGFEYWFWDVSIVDCGKGVALGMASLYMKSLGAFIKDQNTNVYLPKGVMLVSPAERGLRVVSSIDVGRVDGLGHCTAGFSKGHWFISSKEAHLGLILASTVEQMRLLAGALKALA